MKYIIIETHKTIKKIKKAKIKIENIKKMIENVHKKGDQKLFVASVFLS